MGKGAIGPAGPQTADPRQLLWAAVERGCGLDVIYHAKRLLRVSSEDRDVTSALAALEAIHFRYWTVDGQERLNPILGLLEPADLRHVVDSGQLIELSAGDVLCRRGDVGDTMFIVLRGQVAIHGAVSAATPSVTLGAGEVVGELAFALSRRRTADVVALGDTALLSLDHQDVSRRPGVERLVRQFVTGHALEYVSQNVPYLAGRQLAALPEDGRRRWKRCLDLLRQGCHIIEQPAHRPVRLADIRRRDPRTERGGIHILTSGRLTSCTADAKRLDGEAFPLLYVDLPHQVVAPDHEYMVDEGPARILFIGLDAVDSLPSEAHEWIVQGLKRSLARFYHYDVFISYNFADLGIADRWERALADAGLRVFRDTPAQPGVHYPKKDTQALLDSLTMVVLTSPNAMGKEPGENWVLKEVRFREEHFDEQPQIVPVRLPGGDPRSLGVMYSSIQAAGREAEAVEEVVRLVRGIHAGSEEPPHARARHSGLLA